MVLAEKRIVYFELHCCTVLQTEVCVVRLNYTCHDINSRGIHVVLVDTLTCVRVAIGQYGVPPPGPPGMGRGYPSYGAMAPGYPGAAPMVAPGYGYGKSTPFTYTCKSSSQ